MKKLLNKKIFKIIKFSLVFLCITFISNQTYALTTTVSYVGTATDIGGGTFSWANPNNAIGNTTTSSATSTISTRNAYSNNLSLKNFNLSTAGLPSNAIINGITVNVERNVSNNRMRDTTVQLTKDGTTGIGTNNGNNADGPTSKTTTTYGSNTDLWGTTWTAADLLSTNFGVILQYRYTRNGSASVNVYRVRVTIDYSILTETLPGNIIDFEELGDENLYTVTQGTWTRTTNNLYEGTYSIESGNHTDNTTSCFEVTKDILEDSTISFYKNVSSEASYDFLRFYIDGAQQDEWSGEVAWSQSSYSISPGFKTFRWCYEKDYSVSNGLDTAWIDYIEIIGQLPPTSPGGVSSNIQIWLKANAGTSTTTSGNPLNTWNDQSGNGFNAMAGVAPIFLNTTVDNLNYNPIVDFNGTNQYMQNLNNGAYSHNYFAVVVPDSTVDGTLGGQVPFAFDCNSGVLNTGTCGLTFGGLTLGAFTAAINDEVITHAIGSSTGWRSAQIGTASYQSNKPMLINMNENSSGDGTEISEKGMLLDNYNANTYQTLSTADYRLGMSSDAANPFPCDGKIAEIINYSSRISVADKQKIESYLSLKYGMTLNSGTQNYIASNGTTNMWSASLAGLYIHDIFGIGRDDLSGLGQIKSKSVNDDNVITIEAIGEGTNLSPNFTDINDLEFLTIANNNLGNTWTATDTTSGFFNLSRYWKVQESGEVGSINLDFDVANPNFDIPTLSTGTNYYFVYDSNNNGLLSDEIPLIMTNTSGSIWRRSGIHLNNGQIFTISTQASTNNIPTNIILSNNSINENVIAGTAVGTLSTTDADVLDTHTYSLVSGAGDNDNSSFSISLNTLSINYSPDFELKSQYFIRIETDDGNSGTFQKQFTININNVGEGINSIIDFENISDEQKYNVNSGNWTRTTTNPYEGVYSLESDNAGLPNTQSCFEITNTFNTIGTLSFYYNVSSQTGGDFLRFYIDNIEQQAWSGTIPWTLYTDNNINIGTHIYKWCYIKDGATNTGTDNAFIDYITFNDSSLDSTPPVITSTNYASGTLLPGGNHNIIINYNDSESGINSNSDLISLNKWNGSTWGSDISASGLNVGSKTVTATSATYTTNNLDFGKYRYSFQIYDNDGNTSSTGAVFYIDEPEIIVSSGSLDIGKIQNGITKFSTGELNITVKTVGAGFNLILNKDSALLIGYDIYVGSGDFKLKSSVCIQTHILFALPIKKELGQKQK